MSNQPKCHILANEIAVWAWQPFGLSDDAGETFTMLGSHYRGFPVIKVSDEAKQKIQSGETVNFVYQKRLYTVKQRELFEVTY
jgi:hypothetical protein